MYSRQYAEAIEDDPAEARLRERAALDHSIALMEEAESAGISTVGATKAIFFTSKLWSVLVEDLADPGNMMPPALRAQIISIGIWILRELERLRSGEATSFADVIVVSKAIRDGLP